MTSVFLVVDTCASMNKTLIDGVSLIDIVKVSIESVVKLRLRGDRSGSKVRDRFVLVYYDNKLQKTYISGYKSSYENFISKLKYISCLGSSRLNHTLRETFEFVNTHRLASGIETFSSGRKPMYIEPTCVIILTALKKNYDIKLSSLNSKVDGFELYLQPFRWDHKIFPIYLTNEHLDESCDSGSFGDPIIAEIVIATRGIFHKCSNLNQCINDINLIIDVMHRNLIRINFFPKNESLISFANKAALIAKNSTGSTENQNMINLTFFPANLVVPMHLVSSYTNWPIPEIFIPETLEKIPPRSAFPYIIFSIDKPRKFQNGMLTWDSYIVESKELYDYLSSLSKINADFECTTLCLNSNEPLSPSFAFLSLNHDDKILTLNVSCFNFEIFNKMLEKLVGMSRSQIRIEMKIEFENFLTSIPSYYFKNIRHELKKLNISTSVFSEYFSSNNVNPDIVLYLNNIMNLAKQRIEKNFEVENQISSQENIQEPLEIPSADNSSLDPRDILLRQKIEPLISRAKYISMLNDIFRSKKYRKQNMNFDKYFLVLNPFDINLNNIEKELESLINQLVNFKKNKGLSIIIEHDKHHIPISKMGDYQSRVKPIDPERLLDPSSYRQINFGNPFKNKQQKDFSANEADIQSPMNSGYTRATLQKIKMNKRRKTFKICSFDISSVNSSVLMDEQRTFEPDGIMIDDYGEEYFELTRSKAYYYLHQRPFSDYLNECYLELRKNHPSVHVLKKCVENCQNAIPILIILLTQVRKEAVLFKNNKFIDFVDTNLTKLES